MNFNIKVNWRNLNGAIALYLSLIGGFISTNNSLACAGILSAVVLLLGAAILPEIKEIIKAWKGMAS